MSAVVDGDDQLLFVDDTNGPDVPDPQAARWKVLVVDDEPDVHEVTKMALNNFSFDGCALEFLCAYSAREAERLINQHADIAVILLDVVMEIDHAGLKFARYVRDTAKNTFVRIVLRTGQPGQAPEREVITQYDINDYKEKTELTAQKLFTLMYASLRSYRDIVALEANKRGLERVIEASSNIIELQNMEQFTHGVLQQITPLLHLDQGAAYLKADGLAVSRERDNLRVIAGTGAFEAMIGQKGIEVLDKAVIQELVRAIKSGRNRYEDGCFTGFFKNLRGTENLIYMSGLGELSDLDRSLLKLFSSNIGVAFENIELHQDLEETQREIVYMLGEAVETRSRETGNHVKRVAEISKLLALDAGLAAEKADVVYLASPMHDVGKIGIADSILNKPGKHTAEEWLIMKTHAQLGYEMLQNSKRPILQAGAIIARDHHEKWAGGGYPNNLKGEEIHIYGRISAVADVFDALGSERCYKKAWPMSEIVDLFKKERGQHFDPNLVDGLMNNLDRVMAIRDCYAD